MCCDQNSNVASSFERLGERGIWLHLHNIHAVDQYSRHSKSRALLVDVRLIVSLCGSSGSADKLYVSQIIRCIAPQLGSLKLTSQACTGHLVSPGRQGEKRIIEAWYWSVHW